MSTYKHIAIAGGLTAQGPLSASLGAFFARALLNEKAQGVSDAEVIILGRASAVRPPPPLPLCDLSPPFGSPSLAPHLLSGYEIDDVPRREGICRPRSQDCLGRLRQPRESGRSAEGGGGGDQYACGAGVRESVAACEGE